MPDLSFLEKFTKGNKAKMKRYISMYLKIAPDIFDRMRTNIQEQNWDDLAINAHSLKPQADYMGLLALKEVLIEIETKAKNKHTADLPKCYTKALQLHQEGVVWLTKELRHLV